MKIELRLKEKYFHTKKFAEILSKNIFFKLSSVFLIMKNFAKFSKIKAKSLRFSHKALYILFNRLHKNRKSFAFIQIVNHSIKQKLKLSGKIFLKRCIKNIGKIYFRK